MLVDCRRAMAGYVLIVEKDAELQRRIGAVLQQAGYELAAETEASWAKRSIAVRPPDLIVIDTRLGDGDGFQLAEDLRDSPDTRTTPIVFIASTHRGASHRAEARRRFAPAEYLPTPLDVQALLPHLAALSSGAAPLPTASPGEEDVPPTPPPIVKASLRDPAQQRERRDVERSAKSLVADSAQAAFAGTLKKTPLARLLQRLYAQRATGSLLLLRDATKKIVMFADGYPVSVRSNVLGECLGQILLEKRLISSGALAESVQRMQKEKRQQGQILIEMGALSPYNLERALVDQLEAKLFEIFSWPDGKFLFKADDSAPGGTIRLERSPAALILEGIRRHYDQARQSAALDRYANQYFALSADPLLRLQEMTSNPTELAFIRSIDGTRRLEEILARAQIPREQARLLLVALSEAGMIQSHETTSRRKPPAPSAVPAPVPPAPASAPPLGSGELSMMLQMARTQDYFWVLGIERNAAPADIDRAYEALARSFHADRYRLAPDDDRKTAQEMFDCLTEAHRVLQDPARRRTYLAKLERTEPPPGQPRADERPAPTAAAPHVNSSSPSNSAAQSLYEVGLEHLRARRHHEAVEVLRQAARLIPNQADYRAALGWALFRQAPADARAGRAAIAELRRATQIDERHRTAAQHLAEIYAQTGQPDLAIAELERLLALDPGALELAEELRRLKSQ
jgi:DNA-binding response OmpR family regulator/tetratricopeptide (TPR) repeat protein